MNNLIDTITIIGGGFSLQKGINLGLYDRIKDKCTFALNYEYKYFDGTIICFTDTKFYNNNKEQLKNKPLIVGIDQNCGLAPYPNTYILKTDPLKIEPGKYAPSLTGYTAISLAIWLLNKIGNIYLLGYDWTKRTDTDKMQGIKADPHTYNTPLDKRTKTHCHTDTIHRGVGFTSYYETNDPNIKFEPFLNEKEIHIYNVSPSSNITCFPKINYLEFFKQINDSSNYNQEELQTYIKTKLTKDLK
jgi:hypothetical protein